MEMFDDKTIKAGIYVLFIGDKFSFIVKSNFPFRLGVLLKKHMY